MSDGSCAYFCFPLSRKGVCIFLEREDGLRSASTVKEILDLVWKEEQRMSMIFKVVVYLIKKYNAEAIFLQLIATRFLEAI